MIYEIDKNGVRMKLGEEGFHRAKNTYFSD